MRERLRRYAVIRYEPQSLQRHSISQRGTTEDGFGNSKRYQNIRMPTKFLELQHIIRLTHELDTAIAETEEQIH